MVHARQYQTGRACGQADLEAKYARVLSAYARDLANVQAQYERHKLKPPLPRNAPRVAGHILWARQLLRRIEAPMQRCAARFCWTAVQAGIWQPQALHTQFSKLTDAAYGCGFCTNDRPGRNQSVCVCRFAKHKALLSAKDSKRIVRQYNLLATTLVKFEALWHGAWLSGVEQSRAALHSALIVRHPQTGADHHT